MIALSRHDRVELQLERRAWSYPVGRAVEIERHWQQARTLSPAFFNGAIHMLTSGRCRQGCYRGEIVATDFCSFIHWRALGHPDRSVRCVGVGALLWSADGAVLLGTAASGMSNAGRTYVFSGALDERDVDDRTGADVVAGAVREIVEETGLQPKELEVAAPWIWSVEDGVWINFVCERRSSLSADALRTRILDHNAGSRTPELADVVIVRAISDLDRPDIFGNTRAILAQRLSQPSP